MWIRRARESILIYSHIRTIVFGHFKKLLVRAKGLACLVRSGFATGAWKGWRQESVCAVHHVRQVCGSSDSAGVTPAEASQIHQAWWALQARLDSRSSRAGSRCQSVLTLFSGSSSARVRSVISGGFDPRWVGSGRNASQRYDVGAWCDSRWKQCQVGRALCA